MQLLLTNPIFWLILFWLALKIFGRKYVWPIAVITLLLWFLYNGIEGITVPVNTVLSSFYSSDRTFLENVLYSDWTWILNAILFYLMTSSLFMSILVTIVFWLLSLLVAHGLSIEIWALVYFGWLIIALILVVRNGFLISKRNREQQVANNNN